MKKRDSRMFVSILAVGLCMMAPRAEAQFASPVKVLNAPDAPVPVKDTRVTISTSIVIPLNGTTAPGLVSIPTCPGGMDFLVTSVTTAPLFFVNPNILQLPAWAVLANVVQKTANGSVSKPIVLYGNGPQHLSVTLPAGQPTFSAGFLDLFAQILTGPSPARFEFVIHVSGYCGVAFVAP